jgi:DNA-binding beta-propeller fold protein YncE
LIGIGREDDPGRRQRRRGLLEHMRQHKVGTHRLLMKGACTVLFGSLFLAQIIAQAPQPAPLHLIQTIPLQSVDGRLDHMSVDAKGQRLFVSGLANGTVEVVDLKLGKRIHTLTGIKEPEGLLYVPDGNVLYVADGEGGAVHAFDGESYKLIRTTGSLPHSDNLRYDPNTQRLYVGFGDGSDSGLGILDAKEGSLIGVVNLEGHPESFQFETTSGRRMFVNCPTAGHIAVIDPGKRRVIAKWPVISLKSFYPMDLDEANQRLFIGSRRPAKLAVFDTKSGQQITSVDGGVDTDDLFYDSLRKRLYMSGGDGFVRVYEQRDADHYQPIAKVPTGVGARISLFVPSLNRLYVAVPRLGRQSAQVLVFEVQS